MDKYRCCAERRDAISAFFKRRDGEENEDYYKRIAWLQKKSKLGQLYRREPERGE